MDIPFATYSWLSITRTLKWHKAIIMIKIKIVSDKESSSYPIWIPIGFVVRGPVKKFDLSNTVRMFCMEFEFSSVWVIEIQQ